MERPPLIPARTIFVPGKGTDPDGATFTVNAAASKEQSNLLNSRALGFIHLMTLF
ncbi:MAG: hypothetical protein AB8Y83_02300 [Coxiella endosymbiont of Haemaphysalis qinghaiensis]